MPPLERAGFVFAPIGSRYSRSRALSFQQCTPRHYIDRTGFSFQRDEHHAAGGGGALVAGDDASGIHGDLDHLILEDGDAERALQYVLYCRRRIVHRFLAFVAPQVGMHHAAGDGAGPHNGDLNSEVVITAWPQPRTTSQHTRARAGSGPDIGCQTPGVIVTLAQGKNNKSETRQ